MRYLSVCSGIEAATVAWHGLGWEPAAFSEIDKFPSEVLAHHYPSVPNVGDMTRYKEWNIGTIGLLVGGTPCQSFSVAGLRKGMDDPRGNLALVYCGILDHFRPKWFVWENVPGVLSSSGGRDFGSFLGALAQLGYGFAYRVLDAQYFGVAQRRRRVFVVGCLGDWRSAAAVLFERESMRRDLAPSREAGQAVAPTVVAGPPFSRTGNERVECDAIVPMVANTLTARMHKGINTTLDEGQTPIVQPIPYRKSRRAQSSDDHESWVEGDVANTINLFDQGDIRTTHAVVQPIPIDLRNAARDPEKHDEMNRQGVGVGEPGDPAHTITSAFVHGVAHPITFPSVLSNQTVNDLHNVSQTLESKNPMAVAQNLVVRRLTPVECERLQGFPDRYTDIKDKCPDGPRYKALGNSMAVPVMKWIGERIQKVDELPKSKVA